MRIALMAGAGRHERGARSVFQLSAQLCKNLDLRALCKSAFGGIQQYQGARILILQISANIYLAGIWDINGLSSKKFGNPFFRKQRGKPCPPSPRRSPQSLCDAPQEGDVRRACDGKSEMSRNFFKTEI
jgi:hypothetical protein